MSRLSADELVLDRTTYAARRAGERDRMIPLRRDRRLRLGDMIVCEFENAETLRYQVQEMVYAEGISDPAEAAAEVDAYARMLPTSHELSATMFIELDDVRTVKDELRRLAGVHHHLRFEVGGEAVPGRELPSLDDDPGGSAETETSSVHFIRFTFTEDQRDAFRDPSVPAVLVVDHPEYADEVPVTGPTRLSLLADLTLEQP